MLEACNLHVRLSNLLIFPLFCQLQSLLELFFQFLFCLDFFTAHRIDLLEQIRNDTVLGFELSFQVNISLLHISNCELSSLYLLLERPDFVFQVAETWAATFDDNGCHLRTIVHAFIHPSPAFTDVGVVLAAGWLETLRGPNSFKIALSRTLFQHHEVIIIWLLVLSLEVASVEWLLFRRNGLVEVSWLAYVAWIANVSHDEIY